MAGPGSKHATLVGGSKKHGGPDLGPTRAKAAWARMGVNAHSLAEQLAAAKDFDGSPRLTVRMAATLQGFPREWEFVGEKDPAVQAGWQRVSAAGSSGTRDLDR